MKQPHPQVGGLHHNVGDFATELLADLASGLIKRGKRAAGDYLERLVFGERDEHHHARLGHHREGKEARIREELNDERLGALGVAIPRLVFGILPGLSDAFRNSVSLTFLSYVYTVPMVAVSLGDVRTNMYQGMAVTQPTQCAFSIKFTKALGPRIYTGAYNGTGTALTENAVSVVLDNPVMGMYESVLANTYLDPLFRYLHLDDVELQYRLNPPANNDPYYVVGGNTGFLPVEDLGTFRTGPWYNQTGPFSSNAGVPTNLVLDENSINVALDPQRVHRFPVRENVAHIEPDANWRSVAFRPVVPIAVLPEASQQVVEFQRIPPVDLVNWIAGAGNGDALSGNLGFALWYFPHATVQKNSSGVGITTQYLASVEYRFKIRLTWSQLMPPQLFSLDRPTPDPKLVVEWARAVQAAEAAAIAQEEADIEASTTLPLAKKQKADEPPAIEMLNLASPNQQAPMVDEGDDGELL